MSKLYIFFAIVFTFTTSLRLISGVNYGVYLLFVMSYFIVTIANDKKRVYPKEYTRILFLLILCLVINSFVSPYTPPTQYVLLGLLITILPFFHFVISYSISFSNEQIESLIDAIIVSNFIVCVLICFESVLFPVSNTLGFVDSNYYAVGFVASACNQVMALSLFRYRQTRNSKYKKYAIFFIFFVVLTLQFKAIIGTMIVLLGFYFFTHLKKGVIIKIGVLSALIIGGLFIIPSFRDKVNRYIDIYASEGATEGVSRNALYYTSGRIAVDYFPFGTGQGTYASAPSKLLPDRVMADYGINKVYGLDEDNLSDGDFRMDTHWATILGENGIIGLLLYLVLFFYPAHCINKVRKRHLTPIEYRFVMIIPLISLFVESLVLALPGRLGFIFIYSGLMSILCRKLNLDEDKIVHNKDNSINYESIARNP